MPRLRHSVGLLPELMDNLNKEYYFRVAKFVFKIIIPANWNIERMLPSFETFLYKDDNVDDLLFVVDVSNISKLSAIEQQMEFMLEDVNDMGHLMLYKSANGYCLKVDFAQIGKVHVMHASKDFKDIKAYIDDSDQEMGESLNSMIRFAFSQAILSHNAISMHASAVCKDGFGYLFMGKSGTGKSTHASLWWKYIEGTDLLNDDNPTMRIEDNGSVMVYGTPWSGKTACYKNRSAKVRGMVHLHQNIENRFVKLKGVDAFVTLLPSCLSILSERDIHRKVCTVLEEIVNNSSVVIGDLNCLPNKDAAVLCFDNIKI